MKENQKKILLNMSYFTLVGLSILSGAFLLFRIFYSNLETYIKIFYYILTGLLEIDLILDVIFTLIKNSKFISGIILFILSIVSIILSVYILIMQGITFKTISEVEISYFINITISSLPYVLSVFTYILGIKLIDFDY